MQARSLPRRGPASTLTVTWLVCLTGAATAQFSIPRYTIDGGGGAQSGGAYALRGTSGQARRRPIVRRRLALTGGFWSGGNAVSGVPAVEPDSAAVVPGRAPLSFRVYSAAPNPVAEETVIAFDLPEPSLVRAYVYDPAGRLVRTLANETFPAGRHHRTWNRRDQKGDRVAAGIYFLAFDAGAHQTRQKVVIVH